MRCHKSLSSARKYFFFFLSFKPLFSKHAWLNYTPKVLLNYQHSAVTVWSHIPSSFLYDQHSPSMFLVFPVDLFATADLPVSLYSV